MDLYVIVIIVDFVIIVDLWIIYAVKDHVIRRGFVLFVSGKTSNCEYNYYLLLLFTMIAHLSGYYLGL